MNLTHLRLEAEDGIAVVTIDKAGEPINALEPELLGEFQQILAELESDPGIRGVVVTSAKSDFIVGADIRWFASLEDPEVGRAAMETGHGFFARLEALHVKIGKPVVMAIHGAALGGGLELALCGSWRIATTDPRTRLGQPEVQLGVLPAGGGTQRLPRLIGVSAALDLILTGRTVDGRKAAKLGLIDEAVPAEKLLEIARQRAAEPIRRKPTGVEGARRAALERNPIGRQVVFKQARTRVLKETGGNYPAPLKALEAVRIGLEDGFEAGLAAEARFFGELVSTPESKALRNIFFNQHRLAKETFGAEPRPVDKVAVLGGGLMGGGIATVSAVNAGVTTRIKEIDPAGVARGLAYVRKYLDGRVGRHRMSPFEAEKAMLRVSGSHDWVGFANTDLVIEAVFEDLDVKRAILREVESVVEPQTVFASNTSSLPITAIAEASTRPETVLGMHYFSPVEKMPLLEVIVHPGTADWAVATAVEFGRRQGKTVIVVNDGTGFYTSRVLGPYTNEAMFLLAEGVSVEDIDGALEAWGFPVGPLLLADEVGIDVGAKIARIMVDAFGPRMEGPSVMAGLVTDDRKGRKNGRGFYAYDKGRRGGVDETVYRAIGSPGRVKIDRETIQERVTLQFLNEAARCLEEGILRSAADGDIGAVMGLGFPAFRGGPFMWIDTVGPDRVVERLRYHRSRQGDRFEPAGILVEAAENGTFFRQ